MTASTKLPTTTPPALTCPYSVCQTSTDLQVKARRRQRLHHGGKFEVGVSRAPIFTSTSTSAKELFFNNLADSIVADFYPKSRSLMVFPPNVCLVLCHPSRKHSDPEMLHFLCDFDEGGMDRVQAKARVVDALHQLAHPAFMKTFRCLDNSNSNSNSNNNNNNTKWPTYKAGVSRSSFSTNRVRSAPPIPITLPGMPPGMQVQAGMLGQPFANGQECSLM